MTTAIEQTLETYGIENWGAGYFGVNRKGNLIVRPSENDVRTADLKEIIDDLRRRGITTPVLLRFPQLVASQVRKLQRAFRNSIREFEYEGAKYTAARVTLPPPSLKGNTTFRLKGYADASIVALAGSFNNWNQSQYVFGREGDEWICRIELEPGEHAYKFIIDGNWLLDPANPNTQDDDYGVKNSIVIVARLSGKRPQP